MPAGPPSDRYVAELDGIIHPISAEYLTGVIDLADPGDADFVVIILRTPAGLLDSTRTIVSRMITRARRGGVCRPGRRSAASAGFVLTIAADVAAMAPGTHIGAAHPVSGVGQRVDETTYEEGGLRRRGVCAALVEARHRNVVLADEPSSTPAPSPIPKRCTEPPLIDLSRRISTICSPSRPPHDRAIRRPPDDPPDAGRRAAGIADVAAPAISRHHRRSADRLLLLTLGLIGLTVELWTPRRILPGVAGGLSLLLAFFAFQILPVNTSGLLLILFGLALLVLESRCRASARSGWAAQRAS